MHEILESEDLEKALADCELKPATLFSSNINDQQPPNFDTLTQGVDAPIEMEYRNQNSEQFERELKLVSGLAEDVAD